MRAAQAIDPDAARGAARDILRDRRFHRDPAPRPLRGPLQWLGDRLQTVGEWIARVLRPVPGFVCLGLAIALVAAVVARIIVVSRRRHVTGDRHGAVRHEMMLCYFAGYVRGGLSADASSRAAECIASSS